MCDSLATTLDASEAGERSDLGRLASPLFPQDRETSANPLGIYHSNRESSGASSPLSVFVLPLQHVDSLAHNMAAKTELEVVQHFAQGLDFCSVAHFSQAHMLSTTSDTSHM